MRSRLPIIRSTNHHIFPALFSVSLSLSQWLSPSPFVRAFQCAAQTRLRRGGMYCRCVVSGGRFTRIHFPTKPSSLCVLFLRGRATEIRVYFVFALMKTGLMVPQISHLRATRIPKLYAKFSNIEKGRDANLLLWTRVARDAKTEFCIWCVKSIKKFSAIFALFENSEYFKRWAMISEYKDMLGVPHGFLFPTGWLSQFFFFLMHYR